MTLRIQIDHPITINIVDPNTHEILTSLEQIKERLKIMPSQAELKTQVDQAVADITAAVTTAVQTETAQVVQAISDAASNGNISQEFADSILNPLKALPTAIATAIDSIKP